jgi:hypothetical protein
MDECLKCGKKKEFDQEFKSFCKKCEKEMVKKQQYDMIKSDVKFAKQRIRENCKQIIKQSGLMMYLNFAFIIIDGIMAVYNEEIYWKILFMSFVIFFCFMMFVHYSHYKKAKILLKKVDELEELEFNGSISS